jgi:sulfofructose kinase
MKILNSLLTTPTKANQLRSVKKSAPRFNSSRLRYAHTQKPSKYAPAKSSLQYVYSRPDTGKLSDAARRHFPCVLRIFSYSVSVAKLLPLVDIAGVGLNATDTVIRLPHFPAFNSKVEFRVSEVLPGGQVASALVACASWGLKARYVGKIGDDSWGKLQRHEMNRAGIEAHWREVRKCQSQSSFILVDEQTGERTVLWKRDSRLELQPREIKKEWIIRSKLLHVDGHDCRAAAKAAQWARNAKVPVTVDLDNLYPGVEALLENVDYAITSRDFPSRLFGDGDLFATLPKLSARFGCRLAAATLGEDGVLAWDGARFHYCPAFEIKPVDTTGAGDIFHGAFAYGVVRGIALPELLDFCCAAAGLSCLGSGARGGIAPLRKIEQFAREGARRPSTYTERQLAEAGRRVR